MPAPTDDEDVVVPLLLQPVIDRPRGWRGRSTGVVATTLIAFVVTAVVLGRVLDRGPVPRPGAVVVRPTATASASPTPRPARSPEPTATPLPVREVIGGHIPTERRLVYADGLQVLDMATGTLQPSEHPLYDQALRVGDDQLVCACSLGGIPGGDTTVPPSIRFGRYDLAGRTLVQRDLVSLVDVVPVADMTSGFNVTATLSEDQATLYALIETRRPPSWSIDLYEVSVETGKILGHTTLGRLPVDSSTSAPSQSPSPSSSSGPEVAGGPTPDGIVVWGHELTLAAGGGTLYAAIHYADLQKGVWNNHHREWMIPLRGDHPGTATRIKPADALAPRDVCLVPPQFVDADLLVAACVAINVNPETAVLHLRRLTRTGTSLEDVPLADFAWTGQLPGAVLDRGARALFLWDAARHVMRRVDVDSGAVKTLSVPDSLLPGGARTSPSGGIGPGNGFVESPDGRRLYAVGLLQSGGPAGRSSGVWVFDARTLDLVDHWAPRALLMSLAVSADGAFVYAAGAPGFDVDGAQGSNPASVTVYDAGSGEIQVLYGSVSSDTWVIFPTWQ